MIELLLLVAAAVAYFYIAPASFQAVFFSRVSEKSPPHQPDLPASRPIIPEDSTLRRHFLTQLRADIEDDLLPNRNDPALRHYYEASVAAEFQKRLSEIAG